MSEELKCPLCDAGAELIGDYHYLRVGGMVFPTNRKCQKLAPAPNLGDIRVAIVAANYQCQNCGDGMNMLPISTGHLPDRIRLQHPYRHACPFSELEYWLPISYAELEPA